MMSKRRSSNETHKKNCRIAFRVSAELPIHHLTSTLFSVRVIGNSLYHSYHRMIIDVNYSSSHIVQRVTHEQVILVHINRYVRVCKSKYNLHITV